VKLATPQINYYLGELRQNGVKHSRQEFTARKILEQELQKDEEAILQVLAALPDPPRPAVPAPKPEPVKTEPPVERSKEEIAAVFRKAKGEDKPKKLGLAEPAKRIELKPENQFRIYHPAPVVAINRYGVVRWVADGRQHKAGELIKTPPLSGQTDRTIPLRRRAFTDKGRPKYRRTTFPSRLK
jgi:hypothetical protein